ncbi:UNVERIFIED_CONTAM: hypothetical protein FKN15_064464 [Acipenser sinensis]
MKGRPETSTLELTARSLESGLLFMKDPATLHTVQGFYMIVDTSHDVMSSGQSASLYSGLTSALRGPECVQFWYHMSGDKPGRVGSLHRGVWRLHPR